jgi:hypothetical protein
METKCGEYSRPLNEIRQTNYDMNNNFNKEIVILEKK